VGSLVHEGAPTPYLRAEAEAGPKKPMERGTARKSTESGYCSDRSKNILQARCRFLCSRRRDWMNECSVLGATPKGSTFDVCSAIIGSNKNARSMRLASHVNWNAAPLPSKDQGRSTVAMLKLSSSARPRSRSLVVPSGVR